MKINSVSLAQAATLAGNIEVIEASLNAANETVSKLNAELAPLRAEYNTIMGVSPKTATRPDGSTGRFTQEHRDKISAALKASHEKRRLAKLATSATDAPVAQA